MIALILSSGQITPSFGDGAKSCVAGTENEKGWLFVNNCDREVVIEICFEETSDEPLNCGSVIQHQGDRLYPATLIAAKEGLQILSVGGRAGIRWGACYHDRGADRNPGKPEGEYKFTYRCKNSNVE
ncbi:hypothetical protein LJR231_003571 [Phyllobacterium sp. LjRoot231]|uniref:hypothetical protein n=1 Tax=Phyllobacterium sp. LjRoot231 TaxID=3342289 RepID=UPI003ECFE13B